MLIDSKQRRFWRDYEEKVDLMTDIYFGDALIRVARPTVSAWDALEAIMHSFNYRVSPNETSGYTPKAANSTVNDLRSFGIAVNVNAASNPQRQTTDKRKVWFSSKPTQVERAHDVLENAADTDMSADMIDAIKAVRTLDKKRVFGWGGDRPTKKSAGLFFINVSPEELARGLDNRTVRRLEEVSPKPDEEDENFDTDVPSDPVLEEEMFGETETMVDVIHVERFRVLLDFIANHEGTAQQPDGGYNTSLGFGVLTGGEKTLTNMTLNQIDALQTLMLNNPKNKWNSSALGRYQIVRTTLRGLRTQLGLTGNELYSPDLQDRLATMLINRRGRSVPGLRAEWASLQKVSPAAILAAYDAPSPGSYAGPEVVTTEQPDITKILEALWERLGVSNTQPFPTPIAISPMPQLALKPGDRGPAVQALQEALSRRNYQVGKIDGIYGSLTTAAVAAFQIDYNVPTDHVGTVDGPTWEMLANAANRPLSEDRLNASADDLRRMGSQIVLNADRTKIVAILTSVLGALGLGKATLGDYGGPGGSVGTASTAQTAITNSAIPVEQQIAHSMNAFSATQYGPFFGLSRDETNAVRNKIQDLDKLYSQSNSSQQTSQVGARPDLVDPLIGLAAGAANIFLPGVGGSLAMLALGVASHMFGSRIINRRVQDQRTGANIGAVGRN